VGGGRGQGGLTHVVGVGVSKPALSRAGAIPLSFRYVSRLALLAMAVF